MANILEEIAAYKRGFVDARKRQRSLADVRAHARDTPEPDDFRGALVQQGIALIAEVKKASPSRGLLRPNFDPVELADTYSSNGAAAISVLTDPRFQGELEHIVQIKSAGASRTAPVLRKDFIFDPYQVYEARAIGADAILLIVAILSPSQIKEYLGIASELGMDCLVEVHDEEEMQIASGAGATIIGINNRDLRTFNTDLAVTERLAPLAPAGKVIVSESGIHTAAEVKALDDGGVDAILVGESLLTSRDIAAQIRQLLSETMAERC